MFWPIGYGYGYGYSYSRDIGEIKATMTLLKWMLGTNLAFTLAIVWRVFS